MLVLLCKNCTNNISHIYNLKKMLFTLLSHNNNITTPHIEWVIHTVELTSCEGLLCERNVPIKSHNLI